MKLPRYLSILLLSAGISGMLLFGTSCGIIKPDGVMADILNGGVRPPCKSDEDAKRDLDRGLCSKLCDDPTGVTFKVDLSSAHL